MRGYHHLRTISLPSGDEQRLFIIDLLFSWECLANRHFLGAEVAFGLLVDLDRLLIGAACLFFDNELDILKPETLKTGFDFENRRWMCTVDF